jgi:ElaB/YqjD/DUF883 family membrane-anchored ribosome-binding protein
MKNRISDYLLTSAPQDPPTETTPARLLHAAQKQLNQRRRWIEKYVQKHPAIGIGAALCIGGIIGWISKRK